MHKKTKKLVVAIIELDEKLLSQAGLTPGQELTELPDGLSHAIDGLTPNGTLDTRCVYLLDDGQRETLEGFMEAHALGYHEHAVSVHGESCLDPNCQLHAKGCVVINLHDRRPHPE